MESRKQGSRLRPRTQKRSEAKDRLSQKRPSRGQGQEYSRPRTKDTTRKCSPKKKLHKFTATPLARSPRQRKKKRHDLGTFFTNNFRELVGFEAKAKDLTYEVKAKNFKMCSRRRPRSQGRPQGLHLWIITLLFKINIFLHQVTEKLVLFLPKWLCLRVECLQAKLHRSSFDIIISIGWYNHFAKF